MAIIYICSFTWHQNIHHPTFRIVKSITARELFVKFPEIKKDLWGGEFWNDGGYIGTVGEGTTADVVRKYILRQGSKEEKIGYKQLRLFKMR